MHCRTLLAIGICLYLLGHAWASLDAQRAGAFRGSTDDPAINYASAPVNNVVEDVNRQLQAGALRLALMASSRILMPSCASTIERFSESFA